MVAVTLIQKKSQPIKLNITIPTSKHILNDKTIPIKPNKIASQTTHTHRLKNEDKGKDCERPSLDLTQKRKEKK